MCRITGTNYALATTIQYVCMIQTEIRYGHCHFIWYTLSAYHGLYKVVKTQRCFKFSELTEYLNVICINVNVICVNFICVDIAFVLLAFLQVLQALL